MNSSNDMLLVIDDDQFVCKTALLTHKTHFISTSTSAFLIPPTWTQSGFIQAYNDWLLYTKEKYSQKKIDKIIPYDPILFPPKDRNDFLIFANTIIRNNYDYDHNYLYSFTKTRLGELFRTLWAYNCITWPTHDWGLFSSIETHSQVNGWSIKKDFVDYLWKTLPDSLKKQDKAYLLKIILTITNINEIGDLCPDIIIFSHFKRNSNCTFLSKILTYQINHMYDIKPKIDFNDYSFEKKHKYYRKDQTFLWAQQFDQSMETWVSDAAVFINQYADGLKHWVWAVSKFLDFLLSTPGSTRNPKEYLSFEYPKHLIFNVNNVIITERQKAGLNNRLVAFMDWLLLKYCSILSVHDNYNIEIGYGNPYSRMALGYLSFNESVRSAVPMRVLKEAIEVLTEKTKTSDSIKNTGIKETDLFFWSRTAFRQNQHGTDYFFKFNQETGEWEKIWSPVRTCALLLKLLLPVRTSQILAQESSECDLERYCNNKWIKNDHLLAANTSTKSVSTGALRKYQRKDGSEGALIYFNTNKTGERYRTNTTEGYLMPWENIDAINIYQYLDNWQRKYFPVTEKTPWTKFKDLEYRRSHKQLLRKGSSTFLFRDPTLGNGSPISYGKVEKLWKMLLHEVEKRLQEKNETNQDGSPIKLVLSRTKGGVPIKTAYDLHSLRVTGITLLYEQGVPIEAIMKVVGHSSFLMTLYYTKLNSDDISITLDKAFTKALHEDQVKFVSELQITDKDILYNILAHNDPCAIDNIYSTNTLDLSILPHGICPVNKSKCAEGLVRINEETGKKYYESVPNGSTNCARCRYFITGPMFLPGLISYINAKSYTLLDASKKYQQAQSNLDNYEFNLLNNQLNKDNFQSSKYMLEQIFVTSLQKVDEAARDFSAGLLIYEQVNNMISNKQDKNKYTLLLSEKYPNWNIKTLEGNENMLLDDICQSAEIFEGLQIDWNLANLRRLRLLSSILESNNLPNYLFFDLDEKQILVYTNEIFRFLKKKINLEQSNKLLNGFTSLEELGILSDFKTMMQHLSITNASQVFLTNPSTIGDDNVFSR